jgi:hypothetical protein
VSGDCYARELVPPSRASLAVVFVQRSGVSGVQTPKSVLIRFAADKFEGSSKNGSAGATRSNRWLVVIEKHKVAGPAELDSLLPSDRSRL